MRLALVTFMAFAGTLLQDDVKKVAPDAEKIKKLSKKISAESRAKIEKALGQKLDDKDLAPVLYECSATPPLASEKTSCIVSVVAVKGPKGVLRVAVLANPGEKTLYAARLMENGDDKALEEKFFLKQFDALEYSENLYAAPTVLAAVLQKAAAGKDDAAKETAAVIRMNVLMRAAGPAWARLMERVEKKDKAAAADAAAVEKGFEEVAKVVKDAKFLKPAAAGKFAEHASATLSELGAVRKLIDGGKFDDAARAAGDIDSRCDKCHGSTRRAFRERREHYGVANGFFSTKLEVAVPEPGLEASAQALADGIRKALLLASEAR